MQAHNHYKTVGHCRRREDLRGGVDNSYYELTDRIVATISTTVLHKKTFVWCAFNNLTVLKFVKFAESAPGANL